MNQFKINCLIIIITEKKTLSEYLFETNYKLERLELPSNGVDEFLV